MNRPSDRRNDLPRIDSNTPAEIRVGRQRHACLLENISPNGAGLKVDPNILLPPLFELTIGKRVIPSTLMWRSQDRVGVYFAEVVKLKR